MQNTELTDIEASLQTLVRRAYDMGRNDALKKVVDVLNADRPCSEQRALMAPGAVPPRVVPLEEVVPPELMPPEPEHEEANGVEVTKQGKPWWAWPVR